MTGPIPMLAGHALVGRWRDAGEWSLAEYTIRAEARGFSVSAVDTSDGEVFDVSDVTWDGTVLRFVVVVPSNGHRVENPHVLKNAHQVGGPVVSHSHVPCI